MRKQKVVTTEEFISSARKIHGDKYDYSKSIYTLSKNKVIIGCPIHGEFLQSPNAHLSAEKGCHKCGGNYPSNSDEFIDKVRKVHGDKYDYSLVKYSRAQRNITILCPTHGRFQQKACAHLSGKGCIKCAYKRVNDGKRYVLIEFVQKAREVHGDKYDYSNSIYKSFDDKINILCPKHGKFHQTVGNHLSGKGCKKCSNCISHKEVAFLDVIGIRGEHRQQRIFRYLVDGIDPTTNTVYEFLGDFWHGNPKTQKSTDVNRVNKQTFGQLLLKTKLKLRMLSDKNYKVKYIWESDWDSWTENKSLPIPIREFSSDFGEQC